MDQPHDGTGPVEAGDATRALPSTGDTQRYAEPVTPAATVAPAVAPSAPAVSAPERPRGPHAAAILLGVFAIAVAALAILRETTNLTVSWSELGPGSIIVAGVLLLLIGVVGLTRRGGGRQH